MDFLPDLLTVVEWATVLLGFVMMGSVIPLCLNMYKQRSTVNVPYLLFLISAFLTAMGLQYGLMISSNAMILINIIGAFAWGTYIGVYVLVSKSKRNPLLGLLGVAGLYLAHLCHLYTLPTSDHAATFGLYMMVWGLIMGVIPLLEVFTIVQEKSTNCCDMPMLLGGTMNTAVWCFYGFLLNNIYIYIPSIPGLVVSFIKFGLMLVYGFPSHQSAAKKETSIDVAKIHKDFDNSVNNGMADENLRQRK